MAMPEEPISYDPFGGDNIDSGALRQLRQAMEDLQHTQPKRWSIWLPRMLVHLGLIDELHHLVEETAGIIHTLYDIDDDDDFDEEDNWL